MVFLSWHIPKNFIQVLLLHTPTVWTRWDALPPSPLIVLSVLRSCVSTYDIFGFFSDVKSLEDPAFWRAHVYLEPEEDITTQRMSQTAVPEYLKRHLEEESICKCWCKWVWNLSFLSGNRWDIKCLVHHVPAANPCPESPSSLAPESIKGERMKVSNDEGIRHSVTTIIGFTTSWFMTFAKWSVRSLDSHVPNQQLFQSSTQSPYWH